MNARLLFALFLLATAAAAPPGAGPRAARAQPATASPPNIVLILADDLGIGDVPSYNPDSNIPMPHVERLADEGRRFTDAHASGSWCTPSRYGLMTGRYPFREDMRAWTERALIAPEQTTLASLLQDHGYRTGMVGKWHLGFEGGADYDCSKPLDGGPVDHGFDQYFGIPASLDIPPYFYIEGDACRAAPSAAIYGRRSAKSYWNDIQGAFWREGGIAPGFRHANVLPRWRERAVAFLEDQRRRRGRTQEDEPQPFFLYLALTAPHTPWLPLEPFRGQSGAGSYGDFAMQVDRTVGSVLQALERLGMADDTLVLFISDNGPVWYSKDEERFGHRSTYIYRGMKGDAWEGGHRMPFIARWPGHIPAGTVSDETIAFTDLLATTSALLGTPLPEGAGEDSYDVLPLLLGQGAPPAREALLHSGEPYTAIRQGKWKFIPGLGSGGFTAPAQRDPESGEAPAQLYNLADDPDESDNVYDEHPEVVERLSALLERYEQGHHGP